MPPPEDADLGAAFAQLAEHDVHEAKHTLEREVQFRLDRVCECVDKIEFGAQCLMSLFGTCGFFVACVYACKFALDIGLAENTRARDVCGLLACMCALAACLSLHPVLVALTGRRALHAGMHQLATVRYELATVDTVICMQHLPGPGRRVALITAYRAIRARMDEILLATPSPFGMFVSAKEPLAAPGAAGRERSSQPAE